MSAAKSVSSDETLKSIQQLIKADTWLESRQIIETKPELLSDEAILILEQLVQAAQQQGDIQATTVFKDHLELLRRCRGIGVVQAFKEINLASESSRGTSRQVIPLLHELSQPFEYSDVPRRIALCESALNLVEQGDNPILWSSLQAELATSLLKNPFGNRPENLERAIVAYKQALKVYTRKAFPKEWAMIQNNLGDTYSERIRGERAENLEQAILHYGQALEVFTRQDFPEQWAMALNNLGATLRELPTGDRATNLEQAIACFQEALLFRSPEAAPLDYAMALNNLGATLRELPTGDRATNLEQAIACFQKALLFRSPEATPLDYATTLNNLGDAYSERIRGERAENLELSILHYEQALEVFTRQAFPMNWAMIQNNLAKVYAQRLRGDNPNNLERAIAACEQALEVFTHQAFPMDWARTQHNLANIYAKRIYGNRAENLERAILHYEQALTKYTRQAFPMDWAMTQHNLGDAYSERIRGERAENLELSILHYEQALEVFTRQDFPEQWANTQHNLGNTYVACVHEGQADKLGQAVEHLQLALEVFTRESFSIDHQRILHNLGDLYFDEQQWENAEVVYNEAIEINNGSLLAIYIEHGTQAEIQEIVQLHIHSAYCLLQLGKPADALTRLEQGKAWLIVNVLVQGDINLRMLLESLQSSILSVQAGMHNLETGTHSLIGMTTYSSDTDLNQTLNQKKAERERILQTLEREYPDFSPMGLDLASIVALIPTDGALVIPLVASQGSVVFVLPYGVEAIGMEHIIWLESFTDKTLYSQLIGSEDSPGWLLRYPSESTRHPLSNQVKWIDAIDDLTRWLWDVLMGPVHQKLTELSIESVTLLSWGSLSLLPLHAAWRVIDGERRIFLDYYTISYAPSAYSLRASHRQIQDKQPQEPSLLAVLNPTNDLPYASLEAEALTKLFPQSQRILTGVSATKAALMAETSKPTYLHFSCHGFYDLQGTMNSGLVLADGQLFNTSEIISSLNLSKVRLVTLSIPESGLTELGHLPDTYIGLPFGFLQAGIPGVLMSLWPVSDMSTMLLIERFYSNHLLRGMTPPTALREAQLWLRSVSAGELATRFATESDVSNREESTHPEQIPIAWRQFASLEKNVCPFNHPFYWAAFTFNGI